MIPVLNAQRHWECPNCTFTDVTQEVAPHSRFHACRGLRGLTSPMVPAGTRARVSAVDREDYVGSEIVQTDGEGKPVMSIVTEREDGQDCAVLAPLATLDSRS